MRILTVPKDTAILRTKSEPIKTIDTKLQSFLKDLGETLKNQRDPQGVGLSAVQVGRPIRAFATWLPSILKGPTLPQGRTLSDATNELLFYLNPEIIDHSPNMTLGEDLVTENRKQKTENNERSAPGPQPEAGGRRPDNQAPGTRHLKPFLEGCLSIPRVYGPVPRWEWINVRSAVRTEFHLSSPLPYPLTPIPYTLSGLAARVFQHELDHLNGILFTDRTLEAGLELYRQKKKELVEMEM